MSDNKINNIIDTFIEKLINSNNGSDLDTVILIEQYLKNMNDEFNQKPKRGRKLNPDKITPYGRPTDPDYFKKYYIKKLKPVICDLCQCPTNETKLKIHQQSKKCKHIQCLLNK